MHLKTEATIPVGGMARAGHVVPGLVGDSQDLQAILGGLPIPQLTSSHPTPWIFTILLLLLIPHQVETRTVGLN